MKKIVIGIYLILFIGVRWAFGNIIDAGGFLTSSARDEFIKIISYYDDKFSLLAKKLGKEYSTELLHTIISSNSTSGEILNTLPHVTFGVESAVGFIPSDRIFSDIDIFEESPIPSVSTPYIGFTLGTGFLGIMDLRIKYFTLPKISSMPENLSLNINYVVIENRYNIFEARAFFPTITAGVTFCYSFGDISYPYNTEGNISYSESYFQGSGSYDVSVQPKLSWKLLSLGIDIRLSWSIIGIIKPFIGFGIGINGGKMNFEETISGNFDITLKYTEDIPQVEPMELNEQIEVNSDVSEKPQTFINYWSIGFELNLFLIKFGFLISINMYNKAGSIGFATIFSI